MIGFEDWILNDGLIPAYFLFRFLSFDAFLWQNYHHQAQKTESRFPQD